MRKLKLVGIRINMFHRMDSLYNEEMRGKRITGKAWKELRATLDRIEAVKHKVWIKINEDA